jgi:hypothetical protein
MEEEVVEKKSGFLKVLKIILIIIVLLLIILFVYMHLIEPSVIKTNEQAIIDSAIPSSFNGLKIAQISDIHYGTTINDSDLEKIVEKTNAWNPDVLIYTGDLFDDAINISDSNISSIKEILSNLSAKLKKYAVIGDSDYLNKDLYVEIMESAGFTILENENDLLYYEGNDPIMFIGSTSLLEDDNKTMDAIASDENIESYYKIWLAHEPIIIDTLIDEDIHPNIIFAGHTLGGLINISNNYLLNQDGINNYTKSYYHKKKISMYISNGLGTHRYQVRFLNYPTINFYRLYNN